MKNLSFKILLIAIAGIIGLNLSLINFQPDGQDVDLKSIAKMNIAEAENNWDDEFTEWSFESVGWDDYTKCVKDNTNVDTVDLFEVEYPDNYSITKNKLTTDFNVEIYCDFSFPFPSAGLKISCIFSYDTETVNIEKVCHPGGHDLC